MRNRMVCRKVLPDRRSVERPPSTADRFVPPIAHDLRRVPSHSDSTGGEALPTGQTFFSSGSSSSEIIRMLCRATLRGMPAQWVRKVRWFTPNSSQ